MTAPTLHIISQPLTRDILEHQLRLCQNGDGMIFIQDGCYLLKSALNKRLMADHPVHYYALIDDLNARQIQYEQLKAIDYNEFVDLSLEYAKTISW